MVPFPLNDGLLIATHRSKLPNPLKTVKYIWAEDDSISAVTLINLVLLPRSIMYKAAIGAKDVPAPVGLLTTILLPGSPVIVLQLACIPIGAFTVHVPLLIRT
jgi:hypothetical protein